MSQDQLIKALRAAIKDTPVEKRGISVEIDVRVDSQAENCIERLREAYAVMRACYDETYNALQVIRQRYLECSQSELSDVLFALIQTSKFADDIRKEYDKTVDDIKKVVCERWVLDPASKPTIHGKYSNSQPAYKTRARMPKLKDEPEKYYACNDWLGIPKDLQDHGMMLTQEGEFKTKVVEIDYNGFASLIERYTLMNIPIPDFIYTYDEATVKVMKAEDLL